MTTYHYTPLPAVDDATGDLVLDALAGAVYAVSDTGRTTPLTITPDATGSPTTTLSITDGRSVGFTVENEPQVVWVSGANEITLTSLEWIVAELLGRLSDPTLEAKYLSVTYAFPSLTFTSGGQLYDDAGTLKYEGPSGTVTTIANP